MKTLIDYATAAGDQVVASRGDLARRITGVTNDSRRVAPGDLFVAIRGAKLDGREFIDGAIARGAAAIALAGDGELPELSVPVLDLRDDYIALSRFAECRYDWPARRLRLVGITGTNGKTTTAYLLRAMLRAAEIPTGLIGTVQYDVNGMTRSADRTTPTPLELQAMFAEMVDAGVDTAVLEVSSHALCQRRLGSCRLAAGVFTNLTRDHLDYHGDMENYFAAKRLLFSEYLAAKGTAIINADDPYGRRLAAAAPNGIIHYSRDGEGQVSVQRCQLSLAGAELDVATPAGDIHLHSPLVGAYNVSNVLAALSAGLSLGVPLATAAEAVSRFTGVPGRLQRVGGNVFIDYAHTDDALDKVLATLHEIRPRQLLVVFGCGGDRDRSKRPLMGAAAARWADRVFVTSDNPRTEDPAAIIGEIMPGINGHAHVQAIVDRREAIAAALAEAGPEDLVLIAGKGHEDYQEVGTHRYPFSDYQVANEYLTQA